MSRKDTGRLRAHELLHHAGRFQLQIPDLILWVDPGESTGWAAWLTYPIAVQPQLPEPPRFLSGQAPRFDACDQVRRLLLHFGPNAAVGWEDFLVAGGHPHDQSALKVIGTLEWLCHHQDARVLSPQPSSARNLALRGDHLRRLGWHRPGERDANAAAAHLLAYLLRTNQLPTGLIIHAAPEVVTGGDR